MGLHNWILTSTTGAGIVQYNISADGERVFHALVHGDNHNPSIAMLPFMTATILLPVSYLMAEITVKLVSQIRC